MGKCSCLPKSLLEAWRMKSERMKAVIANKLHQFLSKPTSVVVTSICGTLLCLPSADNVQHRDFHCWSIIMQKNRCARDPEVSSTFLCFVLVAFFFLPENDWESLSICWEAAVFLSCHSFVCRSVTCCSVPAYSSCWLFPHQFYHCLWCLNLSWTLQIFLASLVIRNVQ